MDNVEKATAYVFFLVIVGSLCYLWGSWCDTTRFNDLICYKLYLNTNDYISCKNAYHQIEKHIRLIEPIKE